MKAEIVDFHQVMRKSISEELSGEMGKGVGSLGGAWELPMASYGGFLMRLETLAILRTLASHGGPVEDMKLYMGTSWVGRWYMLDRCP